MNNVSSPPPQRHNASNSISSSWDITSQRELAAACCRWTLASKENRESAELLINAAKASAANGADLLIESLGSGLFTKTLRPARVRTSVQPWEVVDSRTGDSLVHIALQTSTPSVAVLQALVAAGCDVNARDLAGRTPLHAAFIHKPMSPILDEIIIGLLQSGADARACDAAGFTPSAYGANKTGNANGAMLRARLALDRASMSNNNNGNNQLLGSPPPPPPPEETNVVVAVRSPFSPRLIRPADALRPAVAVYYAVLLVDAAPQGARRGAQAAVRWDDLGSPLARARVLSSSSSSSSSALGPGRAAELAGAGRRPAVIEVRRVAPAEGDSAASNTLKQTEDPQSGYRVAAALGPFSGSLAPVAARRFAALWREIMGGGGGGGSENSTCVAACDAAMGTGKSEEDEEQQQCPLKSGRGPCDFGAVAALHCLVRGGVGTAASALPSAPADGEGIDLLSCPPPLPAEARDAARAALTAASLRFGPSVDALRAHLVQEAPSKIIADGVTNLNVLVIAKELLITRRVNVVAYVAAAAAKMSQSGEEDAATAAAVFSSSRAGEARRAFGSPSAPRISTIARGPPAGIVGRDESDSEFIAKSFMSPVGIQQRQINGITMGGLRDTPRPHTLLPPPPPPPSSSSSSSLNDLATAFSKVQIGANEKV